MAPDCVNLQLLAIPRDPDPSLTGSVLISDPRYSADVQTGVRSAIDHHPRAGVSDPCRAGSNVGITGPNDHRVRTNRDKAVMTATGRSLLIADFPHPISSRFRCHWLRDGW